MTKSNMTKQKIKNFIICFILVYTVVLIGLYVFQRGKIYYPDTNTPNVARYASQQIEAITVNTQDALTLTGWYRPADAGQPTLIFFHGNAGHYGHRIHNVGDYIAKGYGIILTGYRGYGGNKGSPSEQGLYQDARAYIEYALAHGVSEADLILYGQSIGSGVAVQMAVEYPQAKALVLEAPYTTLGDVAQKHFAFFPAKLLIKDKFDSLSKIPNIKAPVLLMHGNKDIVIPYSMSMKLYEATKSRKEMKTLKGFGHNDMPYKTLSTHTINFIEGKEE